MRVQSVSFEIPVKVVFGEDSDLAFDERYMQSEGIISNNVLSILVL